MWLAVTIASNIGIVLSYLGFALLIAMIDLPEIRLRWRGQDRFIPQQVERWAAVGFFVLCGSTHADLALHALADEPVTIADMSTPYHALLHLFQWGSAAVALFGMGLILYNQRTRTDDL